MSHHHPHIDGNGTIGILSIVITFIMSIWASMALEVAHGIVTLVFGLITCVGVFFLTRWLKRKFPEKK